MLPRSLLALVMTILFCGLAAAQEAPLAPTDRSATGGAQTLEDIIARQNAQTVDEIAVQMQRIIDDPLDLEDGGAKCQKWISDHHSAHALMELQAKAYKQIFIKDRQDD